MIILAIETSCDDTGVAIVESSGKTNPRFNILSNIVSSQVEIHRKWGGVYPTLAKREHQRNLPIVLRKTLKKAGFKISNFQFSISKQIPNSKLQIAKPKIDVIAVTVGPGLGPCLWVGANFARSLAHKLNIPIVPVNHIEAHMLASFAGKIQNSKFKIQNFPAVCLVVSGGHTQLILMKDIGKYKILGETRDDAAGECLDKAARILGLGYPGGPAVATEAAKLKIKNLKLKIKLPRPMLNQKNYDFSFSGLKTAVLYNFKSQPARMRKNKKYIREMCSEIQQAVIDVLVKKTIRAAKNFKAKTILIGGGVAANKQLRKQLTETCQLNLKNCKIFIPSKELCTDNAVMTAVAGYFRWEKGKTEKWQRIQADANLRIC